MQSAKSVSNKLDLSLLKKACEKSPKIRKLFELYAGRDRGRQNCTVPRVRRIMKESGSDLTRAEAIEIMKLWEKAGAGRFVAGRRDQDNRFLWTWDIPSLAKRVVSPSAPNGIEPAPVLPPPRTRVKLPKLPTESEVTRVIADKPSQGVKSVIVRFDGFEIELPSDMTSNELSETEAFIQRLKAMKKSG